MSSVLIWGTGNTAQVFSNRIDCDCNIIIAFSDNDSKKWGGYTSFLPSIPIISPKMIKNIAYDILIICSVQHEEILKQCEEMQLENVFSYQDFKLFKEYPLLENKAVVKNYNNKEIWNQCNLLAVERIVQPVTEAFENYYNTVLLGEDTSEVRSYIWSCWWQGEENAPFLSKKCFESIRSKIVNQNIFMVVITKDNWMEYIEIPDYVLKKVDAGIITYTHLSDIIRIKLLRKYGGLWLDATIYCPYKFDKDILQKTFYSQKEENACDNFDRAIPRSYKSFLIEARKTNILFEFLDRSLMYYWKDKDFLLVYHLFDYLARIAYDSFIDVKKMIDEVPINNLEIETLSRKMNEPFDRKEWERMNESTHFFKLSNRQEYKEYDIHGQMTFYGYFIRGLI